MCTEREQPEQVSSDSSAGLCVICGELMTSDMCGYWNVGDKKECMHIGCAEKSIEVFKVEAVGMGSFYFDDNAPVLEDLMDGCDIGEGYIITKEAMQAGKFRTLPEFTGF